MKLLKLYQLFAGKMTDFLYQFQNNESFYQQARAFWNKLDNVSLIFLIIFVVLGISFAFFYYKSYNNRPGRHYRPVHWILFLAITFIVTFLLTLGFEYIAVSPKLQGAFLLEMKVAIGNGIYASVLYFLFSVLWCNAFPTNAYRLFKF